MELHCSEGLCKRPLNREVRADSAWPIPCPHCSTSLYPRDVLDERPVSDLKPNRAVLKQLVKGQLVEVRTSELPAGVEANVGASVLQEMLDASESPTSGRRTIILVALVVVAVLVVALAVVLNR